MHIRTLQATLGGLLHDIGKPIYRSGGQGGSHSALGAAFLKSIWPGEADVLDCVRYHHGRALRGARLADDSPAYLVYLADNLAAAADRREMEGEGGSFDRSLPLSPVFSHLNGEHPGFSLPLGFQDGNLHQPIPGQKAVTPGEYAAITEKLRSGLTALPPEEAWVNSLLCLLESCLSFVPSSTFTGESPDISLYDHSKVTAAIAACISEYLLDQGEKDYKTRLFVRETQFRQEPAFLLYSADVSGIQKFLFTVATDGALASLRSRSFFLELLMEHYMDELLGACSLSRANLLYSGGGHCYLLLPNTSAAIEAAKAWNERFNNWLLEQFSGQLFIAHGWTACSGNDLTNTPAAAAPYTAMFRRVSAAVSRHKLHRYSPSQLLQMNRDAALEDGRECKVCGRSDHLEEDDRCFWCGQFVRLSQKILRSPIYFVSREKALSDFSLPAREGSVHFSLTDEKTARTRLKNGEAVVRIYSKNQVYTGLSYATRLYVGDYAASSSMEDLCAGSRGIARLAVCRMDVDNLGQAFVSGFRSRNEAAPEKRDHFLTISRTAAFSRQMSLFFKCFINPILSRPEPDGSRLSVAIVYSGGDDVFLVGAWDAVISAAQRIQQEFDRFCCGSLTLSAGISLHNHHFPIRQAAAHSAALEDRAKQTPGKNAIALFDPEAEHTYHWQQFREKVLSEKLDALTSFFGQEEQEQGNAFLYQLLELLRQARQDRMNLARYAYLLARMEPTDKSKQKVYRQFADRMYGWGISAIDRQQLITAIYLYVYTERKQV